jgi:hypothetical protein
LFPFLLLSFFFFFFSLYNATFAWHLYHITCINPNGEHSRIILIFLGWFRQPSNGAIYRYHFSFLDSRVPLHYMS